MRKLTCEYDQMRKQNFEAFAAAVRLYAKFDYPVVRIVYF